MAIKNLRYVKILLTASQHNYLRPTQSLQYKRGSRHALAEATAMPTYDLSILITCNVLWCLNWLSSLVLRVSCHVDSWYYKGHG